MASASPVAEVDGCAGVVVLAELAPVAGPEESAEKGLGDAEETGALGAGALVSGTCAVFIVGEDGMDASVDGADVLVFGAGAGGAGAGTAG